MTAASHAEPPSHSGARPRRCDSVHRHIRAPRPYYPRDVDWAAVPAFHVVGYLPPQREVGPLQAHGRRIPRTMRLAIQTDFRHGGPDSAMATLDEPRPHATWR